MISEAGGAPSFLPIPCSTKLLTLGRSVMTSQVASATRNKRAMNFNQRQFQSDDGSRNERQSVPLACYSTTRRRLACRSFALARVAMPCEASPKSHRYQISTLLDDGEAGSAEPHLAPARPDKDERWLHDNTDHMAALTRYQCKLSTSSTQLDITMAGRNPPPSKLSRQTRVTKVQSQTE